MPNVTSIVGSVVVANGGTVSGPICIDGMARGTFSMPATITSTATTFQVSHDDGVTWTNLYNSSNTQISITIAASRAYPLPAEAFGAQYVRFVLGSAEGAARTIKYSLVD